MEIDRVNTAKWKQVLGLDNKKSGVKYHQKERHLNFNIRTVKNFANILLFTSFPTHAVSSLRQYSEG